MSRISFNLMKLIKQVDPNTKQVIMDAYVDSSSGELIIETELVKDAPSCSYCGNKGTHYCLEPIG